MSKNNQLICSSAFLTHDIIERKIYLIRGKKVMFDRDLAALYGVETRILNRDVLRNINRFPPDFMFQLNDLEFKNLISQFGTSSWGGVRKKPWVFTEYGILMSSSVLNSDRAIAVNIQIMRIFMKLREYLLTHAELQKKIKLMEERYDTQFRAVFETIRQLEEPIKKRRSGEIGFHANLPKEK